MNSQNPSTPVYSWNNPTGKKTTLTGMRIFQDQKDFLEENYPGNNSAVVRFLLSKFQLSSSLQQEFLQSIK